MAQIPEEFLKYAQVVLCDDVKCKYNVALSDPLPIERGPNYTPLFQESVRGVCSRGNLVLKWRNDGYQSARMNEAYCAVRSDKAITRPHFPDPTRIEGGNIPDAVNPGAAYTESGGVDVMKGASIQDKGTREITI